MSNQMIANMTAKELYEAARERQSAERRAAREDAMKALQRVHNERDELGKEHRAQRNALLKKHSMELKEQEKSQAEEFSALEKRIADLNLVLKIRSQEQERRPSRTVRTPRSAAL